jgi:hypothetical protein
MRRRVFFKRSALVLGAGIASYLGWLGLRSREQIIVSLLERELEGLNLEPEGLRQFARDFITERKWPWWRLQGFDLARKWDADLDYVRDYIVRRYILSSDHFASQHDGEPVRYLGLYDPYRRVCANPFSLLFKPS